MERTPFQTPRPPSMGGRSVSIVFEDLPAKRMAEEARASWQREYWATKTVMLSSGLTQVQAYTLASKVLGWNLYDLDRLSLRNLQMVREFFEEELGA